MQYPKVREFRLEQAAQREFVVVVGLESVQRKLFSQ
jgi:hypothetical protein